MFVAVIEVASTSDSKYDVVVPVSVGCVMNVRADVIVCIVIRAALGVSFSPAMGDMFSLTGEGDGEVVNSSLSTGAVIQKEQKKNISK